jgi:hypothetical protein
MTTYDFITGNKNNVFFLYDPLYKLNREQAQKCYKMFFENYK